MLGATVKLALNIIILGLEMLKFSHPVKLGNMFSIFYIIHKLSMIKLIKNLTNLAITLI